MLKRSTYWLAVAGLAVLALPSCTDNSTSAHQPVTFYVSSTHGNDDNDGTSAKTAWKTLAKASGAHLSPGDTMLLRRGDTFVGTLRINGSGAQGAPITVSAYDTGPAPVLDGAAAPGGAELAAIQVRDQDWLTFQHLELTNNRSTSRPGVTDTGAYGLLVENTGVRELSHYRIDDLTVRDVAPIRFSGSNTDNAAMQAITVSSIGFMTTAGSTTTSDVVVENSRFLRGGRFGVDLSGQVSDSDARRLLKDVTFRHNVCEQTGGSCLHAANTENLLIADNTIRDSGASVVPGRQLGRGSGAWFTGSENIVAQGNTVTGARGPGDSSNIHVDGGNRNVLIQYNRYGDNIGYGLEILGGNDTVIVRYNTSIDDGYRLPEGGMLHLTGYVPPTVGGGGPKLSTNLSIYNNTYAIAAGMRESFELGATGSRIYNNIFAAAPGGSIGPLTTPPGSTDVVLTHNLYAGAEPDVTAHDAAPVIGDPRFTRGTGLAPEDCRLAPDSPAVGAGIVMPQPAFPAAGQGIFTGIPATATHDLFGHPLPPTPNIGADQSPTR